MLSKEDKIARLQQLLTQSRMMALVFRYAYPDREVFLFEGKEIKEQQLERINALYDTTLISLTYKDRVHGSAEADTED